MANPNKGEVSLVAGDTTYTLRFTTNAICALEELLGGRTITQIGNELNSTEGMQMATARAVVWAALLDRHPDVEVLDAGDIMTVAGIKTALEAAGRAFQLAFPADGQDARGEGEGARPSKAKAG